MILTDLNTKFKMSSLKRTKISMILIFSFISYQGFYGQFDNVNFFLERFRVQNRTFFNMWLISHSSNMPMK